MKFKSRTRYPTGTPAFLGTFRHEAWSRPVPGWMVPGWTAARLVPPGQLSPLGDVRPRCHLHLPPMHGWDRGSATGHRPSVTPAQGQPGCGAQTVASGNPPPSISLTCVISVKTLPCEGFARGSRSCGFLKTVESFSKHQSNNLSISSKYGSDLSPTSGTVLHPAREKMMRNAAHVLEPLLCA